MNITNKARARATITRAITWPEWKDLLTTEDLDTLAKSVGLDLNKATVGQVVASRFEKACEELRHARYNIWLLKRVGSE